MLLIEPFILFAYIRVYYCIVKKESLKKVNDFFAFQNYVSPCMRVPPLRGLYPMKIQAKYVCCIAMYMLQTGGGEPARPPPSVDVIGFKLL